MAGLMDARSLKRVHERERKAQREFDAEQKQKRARGAHVVAPPPPPPPLAKLAPVVVPPRWVKASSSGDTDVVQKMMTAATLVMESAAAAMDHATGLGVAAHAHPEDSYICLCSVVMINGSV